MCYNNIYEQTTQYLYKQLSIDGKATTRLIHVRAKLHSCAMTLAVRITMHLNPLAAKLRGVGIDECDCSSKNRTREGVKQVGRVVFVRSHGRVLPGETVERKRIAHF